MIIKFTESEFNSAKSNDLLKIECLCCGYEFKVKKSRIKYALKGLGKNKFNFCSKKCYCKHNNISEPDESKEVTCRECGLVFNKKQSELNRTGNHFCSRSCSTTYNNKNKTHGNRRSKLEIWLESELNILYPNLLIDFNKKSAIGSELDIYIPSINLAFELNGIFHYEPIFGINKLDQIQNNDSNKFQLCIKNKIDLCIIDTSTQKYVKPSTSQKYLDIITDIINKRLIN